MRRVIGEFELNLTEGPEKSVWVLEVSSSRGSNYRDSTADNTLQIIRENTNKQ